MSVDGGGVRDAGEGNRCPLTPVSAGDGTRFSLDRATLLPGENMCFSLMYPGLHGWTVPRQPDGHYEMSVALRRPATLEFVWYAAEGDCEGTGAWRRDYWASMYDVAVDGVAIAGCAPRVDHPIWSAMRAVASAAGVTDASTMGCP